MAGQKYDHRVKNKKYTYPSALFMGCGVVERHLEMAKPTKKPINTVLLIDSLPFQFAENILKIIKPGAMVVVLRSA